MRFIAIIGLLCALASCSASEEGGGTVAPGPEQIVRSAAGDIKGLDPHDIGDLTSSRIATEQFEGLTRHNAKGEIEPALARSWESSDDGLSWIFTLKQGLVFSDGHPINAEVFAKVYKRLVDPKTASPTKFLFENVESMTALDTQRLEIKLFSPAPNMPALMAYPSIAALPMHKIEQLGKEGWTSERPMTVSGPYRLTQWLLNDHIKLERNPRWHDDSKIIPNVVWLAIEDSLSALRQHLSGRVDTTTSYPASRHVWLKENHPEITHSVPYLASYYFVFNTRKKPFDNKLVRNALSMAVERQWIVDKVIAAGNLPAWGLLPPGLGAKQDYRPEWAGWPREKRLAEAKKLLKKAGYGANNPLRFEIKFNSSAEHRRVAVAIASMWKDLGVEATMFNSEAVLHFASLRRGDFAVARIGWVADLPVAENFLAVHQTSNGDGNYSGYDSKRFNDLLAKGLRTADLTERNAIMKEAEKQLVADMPILPLYFYVTRSLVSQRIGGWYDNIDDIHPTRTLWIKDE